MNNNIISKSNNIKNNRIFNKENNINNNKNNKLSNIKEINIKKMEWMQLKLILIANIICNR